MEINPFHIKSNKLISYNNFILFLLQFIVKKNYRRLRKAISKNKITNGKY